jgi:hypothetical protein
MDMPLEALIKSISPTIYEEYIFEKFKESRENRKVVKKSKQVFKMPKFKDQLLNCIPIDQLQVDHQAKKYVLARQIPEKHHKLLHYTDNFKLFVSSYFPEYDKLDTLKENEPRLIIPFIKEDENIPMIQGRSFEPNAFLRYITIKKDESEQKIFGLDRIDKSKQIYVVEGPIDSLFIDNCIASADSTLSNVAQTPTDILIHDNEPRNKNICNILKNSINLGYPVVIYPNTIKEKDINDIVMAGYDIEKIIRENTFSGLQADLEFTKWRKV